MGYGIVGWPGPRIFPNGLHAAHLSFVIFFTGDSVACGGSSLWFLHSFKENERSTIPQKAAAVFSGTNLLPGLRNKEVPRVQSQQVSLELTTDWSSQGVKERPPKFCVSTGLVPSLHKANFQRIATTCMYFILVCIMRPL